MSLEVNEVLNANIELIDVRGQSLKQYGSFSFEANQRQTIELNTENVPVGLYLLKIASDKGF